ncbi:hypothetical protein [Amycolatopsis sp. CB00013]|uniref:hypothetical protein n=1 Tax=Amycolatopsis sp. CB00013 TaxID=1703945 RepID=UPI00093CF1C3|nr:hypothetical protein [Amycolatopsis sp. CB00013]OKJ95669.1 hypothetical protein AMK34_21945 [Amycolatopsis sp. CB00013]
MGLFGKRRDDPGLPADIVERVLAYIRTETRSPNAPASFDAAALIYLPLYPLAKADPAGFTARLAAAVLPAGGEAARGGARLVWDLIDGPDRTDPNYLAMLDAGLIWLRSTGVGMAYLTGFEVEHWHTTRGVGNW